MSKDVSQQQWIVILFLVVALVVAVGVAALFGSRAQSQGGLSPTKRFTAKAGTSRENAVALSSRNRELNERGAPAGAGGGGGAGAGGAEDARPKPEKKPLRVRSLSGEEDEESLTETERAIRSAKNSLSPERGIEQLRAQLDVAETDAERAKIYAALADLYAQMDPPDYVRADEMYDMARTFARGPESRMAVARQEVDALLQRDELDRARRTIRTALEGAAPSTLGKAELQQRLGMIHGLDGRPEQAAQAYRSAFDTAKSAEGDAGARETVLRQAGLMLARSYREGGNEEAAAQVAEELNEALGRPMAAAAMAE